MDTWKFNGSSISLMITRWLRPKVSPEALISLNVTLLLCQTVKSGHPFRYL